MSVINRMKSLLRWHYFLYLFAMVAGWPMVFSFMGWLPEYKINYIILLVLSVVTATTSMNKRLPASIIMIMAAQMVVFVVYYFLHSDSSYITRCVYLVITWALLIIQMQRVSTDFVDTNVAFLTLQAIMGGIGFVLFILGVLPVISTFVEFDGHIGQFYGLFTTNATWSGMTRVAGFFDEPGAFAFWGIIALLYNKLFIENRTIEIALIIGLISTLSMAFFIQIAIYACLFYHHKMSKLLTSAVFFVFILAVIASVTPELNDAIWGRFQMNEETGTLQGDNRSHLADVCLDYWRTSPIIGVGAEALIRLSIETGEFVGANPYTFFATDGILGQIILWLPIIYLFCLGKYNKKYRCAAIVIFVGFLQRPYDPTQLWYDVTIYMMILEAYRQIYMFGDMNRSRINNVNFIPFLRKRI